jgi:ribosomal protein L40E
MANRRKGEIETRLERGIEAVKAGENRRARDILTHVIELDQYNEQAWLWLSATVESTADRVVCLENVLFINPRNTLAAAGLQRLHQEGTSPFAPAATLPRLAVTQTLEKREEEEEEDEWEWAGEEKQLDAEEGWEWDTSTSSLPRKPAWQVCPRCNYRNPSWVYVCDRCGADLRPVDLREALGSGAKLRGKSPLTLLAAWGGAFTFNRLLAFHPEGELASWGRSLSALVMAVLFALVWRAIVTVALQLTAGAGGPDRQSVVLALHSAAETLPLILQLVLAYVPVAFLSWLGALLVGGRQGLKVHAHLTAVAYSAWVILIALLAPFITLAPYLPSSNDQFAPLFEAPPALIGVVVGLAGVTWLTQALRTAQRLSAIRATLAVLLTVALSIALLLGLSLLPNEWFAGLVDILAPSPPPWTD